MTREWSAPESAALGQVKTDAHSNEITAIPKLPKTLEVKGCIVTIDAVGCQKKTARRVVKRGADRVLAVKKNHPQLWEDMVEAFEYGELTRFAAIKHDVFETVNKGHGRVERRRRWATSAASAVGHANDRGEMNLAKGEKSLKIGVAAKRKRAVELGVSASDTPTSSIRCDCPVSIRFQP